MASSGFSREGSPTSFSVTQCPALFRSPISKKSWRFVHVAEDYIHVAIVEEVAYDRAARALGFVDTRTEAARDIGKFFVAEISEQQRALPVSREGAVLVHLRIDMSVGSQDIEPSVVVIVEKFRAPP